MRTRHLGERSALEGPIGVLDDFDGREVERHHGLALQEGRLVLVQLDLDVIRIVLLFATGFLSKILLFVRDIVQKVLFVRDVWRPKNHGDSSSSLTPVKAWSRVNMRIPGKH